MKTELENKLNQDFKTAGSWCNSFSIWRFENVPKAHAVCIAFKKSRFLEGANLVCASELADFSRAELTDAYGKKLAEAFVVIESIRLNHGMSPQSKCESCEAGKAMEEKIWTIKKEKQILQDGITLADITNSFGNVALNRFDITTGGFLHIPEYVLVEISRRHGGKSKEKAVNLLKTHNVNTKPAMMGFSIFSRPGSFRRIIDGIVVQKDQYGLISKAFGISIGDLELICQ